MSCQQDAGESSEDTLPAELGLSMGASVPTVLVVSIAVTIAFASSSSSFSMLEEGHAPRRSVSPDAQNCSRGISKGVKTANRKKKKRKEKKRNWDNF